MRDLVKKTFLKLIGKIPGKSMSKALETAMSSLEKREKARKFKIEIELEGLDYNTFVVFLSRLESWTRRLDRMKPLAERASEKCGNWMQYFLSSECTVREFYQ